MRLIKHELNVKIVLKSKLILIIVKNGLSVKNTIRYLLYC
jgi:hypothetical protein